MRKKDLVITTELSKLLETIPQHISLPNHLVDQKYHSLELNGNTFDKKSLSSPDLQKRKADARIDKNRNPQRSEYDGNSHKHKTHLFQSTLGNFTEYNFYDCVS